MQSQDRLAPAQIGLVDDHLAIEAPRSKERLVEVAVRHRAFVLYDSVYQRLDYVGGFINPAFSNP